VHAINQNKSNEETDQISEMGDDIIGQEGKEGKGKRKEGRERRATARR